MQVFYRDGANLFNLKPQDYTVAEVCPQGFITFEELKYGKQKTEEKTEPKKRGKK